MDDNSSLLSKNILNPVWLTISEAAKIGGVRTKTVRRAIQAKSIKYKIVKNRYLVDAASLIQFLHTKTKLKNKLNQYGLGQYIREWHS
jgi:excisionase family DNA binding protein